MGMRALWRFPDAGGHDIAQSGPCPCGWEGPARQGVEIRCREWRHHHFWGCPVAKAAVEQVQRGVCRSCPNSNHRLPCRTCAAGPGVVAAGACGVADLCLEGGVCSGVGCHGMGGGCCGPWSWMEQRSAHGAPHASALC